MSSSSKSVSRLRLQFLLDRRLSAHALDGVVDTGMILMKSNASLFSFVACAFEVACTKM